MARNEPSAAVVLDILMGSFREQTIKELAQKHGYTRIATITDIRKRYELDAKELEIRQIMHGEQQTLSPEAQRINREHGEVWSDLFEGVKQVVKNVKGFIDYQKKNPPPKLPDPADDARQRISLFKLDGEMVNLLSTAQSTLTNARKEQLKIEGLQEEAKKKGQPKEVKTKFEHLID